MLEVREVTKRFSSVPVVRKVSFSVKPGEIVGYLGPNGAGKTTTIKMLAGLLEPSSGEILYQGKRISENLHEYKQKVGYLPEQSELYPHMSGYEYLLLVGRLRGMEEKKLQRKIEAFLEILGLSTHMHLPLVSYSKGMKQKVLLSAALLHNPEILLLDEPLSGLDAATVLVMKEIISRLSREQKIIIYASHLMDTVEKLCSRVIIIYKGRILADDSVANLKALTELPSLEEVFKELVVEEDPARVAADLMEVIKT